MQLIRNAIQALRYYRSCSAADRQYAKDRSRFGLTDAERREQMRRDGVRGAVLEFLVVLVLALAVVGALS